MFLSLFGSLLKAIIFNKVSYYLYKDYIINNARTRIYIIIKMKKSGDWLEG